MTYYNIKIEKIKMNTLYFLNIIHPRFRIMLANPPIIKGHTIIQPRTMPAIKNYTDIPMDQVAEMGLLT